MKDLTYTDSVAAISRRDAAISYKIFGKRVFDIFFALLISPLVIAVVAGVALVMILSGEGANIFFGHRRIGRDGKVFKCWKIRTMVTDAELRLREHLAQNPEAAAQWARDHKLDNDPRITRIGNFLRKTSLDELPQVWNILRGEMSFVGPRPIVRMELHKYGIHRPAYTSVRPGATGLWQVSGRNNISYDERVQLDVNYVQGMTFRQDLKLIAKTVMVVVRPTGK